MMSVELLVCDVDGTLADTEESHRVAFNEAFAHFHLGWAWSRPDYRGLLGVTGGKERLAAFIGALPVAQRERRRLLELAPAVHAEKTRRYAALVAGGAVPLREGVERLLEEALAAGCKLAIASTTTAANVDALLTATLGPRGLHLFSVIACGDQVRAKKPAPDIYRLVLSTLDVPPHRALAFEDSPNGLRAALAAGLWTLLTPTYWTQGGDFDGAGLLLPRLGEPEHPLPGEPGRRLSAEAWVTFDELAARASPPPGPGMLDRLYRGLA